MKNKNLETVSNGEIFRPSISSRDRSYNKSIFKFLLFGLIAVSGYLFFTRPPHLALPHSLLALGIIWCGIAPSILYFNDENRPPFPFLPMLGIFYAIWYGFSAFNDQMEFIGGQSQLGIMAFTLTLAGMVILFISFYLSKNTIWKKITPLSLPSHFSLHSLRFILWCFLVINFSSFFSDWVQELPSINKLFQPFGYIAFGAFFILWHRGNLSKFEASVVFLILFPIEVMFLFSTGALYIIFMFLLFFLIVYWYEVKRVPFTLITCFVLSFLIINPVKHEFRELTWSGGIYHNSNFLDKASLFGRLIFHHHFEKGTLEPKIWSTKRNLNRLNHISEFSLVTQLTPSAVPYWRGETYNGVLVKFIPRVIWPDKPSVSTGQMFGHRYGFISAQDLNTAVNLQWTIEMYANFGIPGVIIGMGLVGMLLGLAEQKLNHPDMSFLEFIVGLTILLPLSQPEGSLVEMLGIVIQMSLVFYLLFQIGLRFKW